MDEFSALEQMFETDGWKEVVLEAEEAVEARKERLAAGCNSIDEMRFLQGEISQLRVLISMEPSIAMKRKMDSVEVIPVEE